MNSSRDYCKQQRLELVAAAPPLALACSLLAAACAAPNERFRSAAATCETAVVVGVTAATDEALADIARATGARFERGPAISAGTAAFAVRAPGAHDACTAVVEQLRSDPRVRFVAPDVRRGVRQGAGE